MASYLKKSLFTLAGFGDPALLPPAEYLATIPQHEEGEDDCTGCFNPCTEHKEFPPHLKIDQAIPMLGSVQPYGRHIIIATGTSDWPYHITNAKDTFAHSLYNAERHNNCNAWKNMITNSSLVSLYSTIPGSCDVMILPDNIMISNVTCDTADDFYSLFLSVPLPIEPMDIDLMMRDDRLGEMKIQKSPYKTLLLLCSHRKVDKRCGITAPILAQELDQLLREKSLDEHDAAILMVSHIGGHQIAGNVICYINDGTRGIWYGRVKTCHCRLIIEETIINGKIIKELYRGAMDKSFKNQVNRSFLRW